ncbi:hypothetical protein TorRG33x02_236950 [Trema orientale]|uniref:Uncharacterized protein n=1 Tax=Trema orientale TaxID=63057 RepID=A0A2P5DZZ5_TREOI|nr:hypothetical protein TorRG33x02_236950 [Trema orientale]
MHIENTQDNMEQSSANNSTKKNLNKKKKKNNGKEDASSSKKEQKKSRLDEKTAPCTPRFTYYTRLTENGEDVPMATED